MDKKKSSILKSSALLATLLLSASLVFSSSICVVKAQEQQPLFSFTCTVPTGWEREYAAMLIIKDSLAKNGISMDIVREDTATFWAKKWGSDTFRKTYAEGGADAWAYYWYWRPEDFLFFSSFTPRGFPPSGWNEWVANNAVIDEALTAGASAYDKTVRKQYYDKFTEEWQRDPPFIAMYYFDVPKCARGVENYNPILTTANAEDWKVKGKNPPITIRIAIPFSENTIDPLYGMTSGMTQYGAIAPVFPNLLKEVAQPDGTYAMAPDLAESYEISNDGLKFTFHLRRNINWTDGVPFTSEDVKLTYEGMLDPASGIPALADLKPGFQGIDAPDKYTVVFRLNQPNALFLACLGGYCTGGIVPAHVFGEVPHSEWRGYWKDPKQVVSLGAYRIVEFVPNERYVLEANPHYWKGRPPVDRIESVVVPEISTAISALKSGEIDIMGIEYGLSSPEVLAALPDLEKIPYMDMSFISNSATAEFGFNLDHPILNNRYVRLAIANLIPVDSIIRDLLKGHGKAASGPIETSSWAYNPSFPPMCQYNPDKAKEYLAKAGYVPKLPTMPTMVYTYTAALLIAGLVVGFGATFVALKRRGTKPEKQ